MLADGNRTYLTIPTDNLKPTLVVVDSTRVIVVDADIRLLQLIVSQNVGDGEVTSPVFHPVSDC